MVIISVSSRDGGVVFVSVSPSEGLCAFAISCVEGIAFVYATPDQGGVASRLVCVRKEVWPLLGSQNEVRAVSVI